MQLNLRERDNDQVRVIDLEGQICLGEAQFFADEVKKCGARTNWKVLLNLSGVTNIDSFGLPQLLLLISLFARQGGELKLLCARGNIAEFLELMGIKEVLPVFVDEGTAINSFR